MCTKVEFGRGRDVLVLSCPSAMLSQAIQPATEKSRGSYHRERKVQYTVLIIGDKEIRLK